MAHRLRRVPLFSALAAGLVLVFAAAAIAATGWSKPQRLAAPQTISNAPNVATNAKNVAVATWFRFKNQGKDLFVRAAVRQRAGRFSSPVTLGSAQLSIGPNPPSFVNAAVDARGDVAVTWLQKDPHAPGKLRVVVAYRPANGRFGRPQAVSQAKFDSFQPQVAVNRRGDFTVVWQRFDNGLFQVQAATRRKGQKRFGGARTLSSPQLDSEFPRIGVAANGRIVVAWRAKSPHDPNALSFIQAVSRRPSGGLGKLQELSDRHLDAARPTLATAPNGKTMVVWDETNGTTVEHAAGAFSSSSGRFGREQVLAPLKDHGGINEEVGLDSRGRAVIVWLEIPLPGKTGDNFIRWATANAKGKIGSPRTLYRAAHLLDPLVAVSSGGAAVAVWVRVGNKSSPLLSAIRSAVGKTLRPAGAVTPAGTSAQAPTLTTGAGVATAAWVRHSADGYSVETSHRALK